MSMWQGLCVLDVHVPCTGRDCAVDPCAVQGTVPIQCPGSNGSPINGSPIEDMTCHVFMTCHVMKTCQQSRRPPSVRRALRAVHRPSGSAHPYAPPSVVLKATELETSLSPMHHRPSGSAHRALRPPPSRSAPPAPRPECTIRGQAKLAGWAGARGRRSAGRKKSASRQGAQPRGPVAGGAAKKAAGGGLKAAPQLSQ